MVTPKLKSKSGIVVICALTLALLSAGSLTRIIPAQETASGKNAQESFRHSRWKTMPGAASIIATAW